MKTQSIWDALQLFSTMLLAQNPEKRANEIFGQTLTALVRFTLPGLGHSVPQRRRLLKAEMEAAQEFMKTLSIDRLAELSAVQEQVFEQLKTAAASRYTYRSRLNAFLSWSKEQIWYPVSVERLAQNLAPRKRHGYGDTKNKCLTTRRLLQPYALQSTETSPILQAELDEFVRFFSAEYYPGRKQGPLKPRTVESHLVAVRMALGWWYRFQAVPLEKLNLNCLVPKVALKQCENRSKALQEAEQAAEHLDSWICQYLEFLKYQRQYQSTASLIQALIGVHALVRFQYARETSDSKFADIPAMRVLREHLRRLQKQSHQDQPVANQDMKWLDLPQVWQRVVSPLRYECAYRKSCGGLRSITAIARSFQIFLAWGLLTFRPPRRQQEFRDLKISLSCSVKRPEGLARNQFIHPLPFDRNQDKYCGYLYKDEDGIWYEDKTPESYKTGRTYHHQKIAVPNPQFPDGKCFYDYLEAFLYGYYRNSEGHWWSGGELADTPTWKGKWFSLRMALNPANAHVFVKPTTGKLHSTSSFYRMIQNSAHRLTGQMVTPHLLRDIYATWFLDEGYTEDRISSLAYAMAHSIEVLRRIYDRRRPQQKIRPIQNVVMELLVEHIH